MFSIFINDIDSDIESELLKFADDTKVWGKANNLIETNRIQKDLDKLSSWSGKNHMPFNVDKCKVMHIGKNNANATYKLLGKDVQVTREEKDLGVVFTEKFFHQ